MVTSTQNAVLPVTVPDAGLEFVLIGPHHGEQQILAQGNNLDLMLLGMARTPAHLVASNPSLLSGNSKTSTGPYANNTRFYSVTAFATLPDQPDARPQPFTFAWIGRTPRADLEPIRQYFDNCVVALHEAILESDPADKLRWHLAPLLFLCAMWTQAMRENEHKPENGSGDWPFARWPNILMAMQMTVTTLLAVVCAFALLRTLIR